eukprot:583104-Amphidinium_carterae.1
MRVQDSQVKPGELGTHTHMARGHSDANSTSVHLRFKLRKERFSLRPLASTPAPLASQRSQSSTAKEERSVASQKCSKSLSLPPQPQMLKIASRLFAVWPLHENVYLLDYRCRGEQISGRIGHFQGLKNRFLSHTSLGLDAVATQV